MNRSRQGQMRSPFKQSNVSSSSLEGMERPARSFKSFLKTVPPNPSPARNNKPLPPTPSSQDIQSPPSPASPALSASPTLLTRTCSIVSWKAPAEWSKSLDMKESLPGPMIPVTRQYSPLLPEPSPDPMDKYVEIRAVQRNHTPLQQSRLMPINEHTSPKLSPPHSPPKFLLPALSKSSPGSEESEESWSSQRTSSPQVQIRADTSPGLASFPRDPPIAPPTPSTASRTLGPSNQGKAFIALGVSSRPGPRNSIEDGYYGWSGPSEPANNHLDQQQHMKSRRLSAVNQGDPLADNSSEDPDMDERTRQLSFSQDYHDLLVDQYQEMSVRPEEVLRDAPRDLNSNHLETNAKLNHIHEDQHRVLRPWSWRKDFSANSSRSASQDRKNSCTVIGEISPGTKRKRIASKINAWVPHHLSVAPRKTALKPADDRFASATSSARGDAARKDSGADESSSPEPDSKVNEVLADEYPLSKLLPPGKPIRSSKRSGKDNLNDKARANSLLSRTFPPMSAPPAPRAPIPLMRHPGGITIVRTPPPLPDSEEASIVESSSAGDQPHNASPPASDGGLDYANSPPTSDTSDHRASYNSLQSMVAVGYAPAARKKLRKPLGFSHSRSPRGSNHPLARELSHSQISEENLSTGSWRRFSGRSDAAWRKPGFFEKAKEARRNRSRETRQNKLKRSIRVIGPIDPGIVEGYDR